MTRSISGESPANGRRRTGGGYRALAILLIAVALAPGLWWRAPDPYLSVGGATQLTAHAIPARTPGDWPTALRLAGVWHLTSPSTAFGGYSALQVAPNGILTTYSDRGMSLRFAPPGAPQDGTPQFGRVGHPADSKYQSDVEAAAGDPLTGRRWFAFEDSNRILRIDPHTYEERDIAPAAMASWSANSGPEAMVRLADGRFIVLSEGAPWSSAVGQPGLLFPFDPVEGAEPLEFTFEPPAGYRPTDMAALPDGRVVILLRGIDPPLPPLFKGMLVIADPAAIEPGKPWPWDKLAELHEPLPSENYEGLAIARGPSGVTMWLIADDNASAFQRTLLLELRWRMAPR